MIALATHGYPTHMPCFKSARALYAIMTSPRERGFKAIPIEYQGKRTV